MKKDIHPKYNKTKVKCTCGNNFEIGSTLESLNIEICSQCHPFYTGKQKLIDDAGVINKYQKRVASQASIAKDKLGKKVKKVRQTTKKIANAKGNKK